MKILFVCLGNICRSPTAEAVFRQRARGQRLSFEIESAGTGGWHAGETPDPRARDAGQARGYSFAGQSARQVTQSDFEIFDLILAMDRRNLSDLMSRCPPQHNDKLGLFLDYAPDQSAREVPDPYYGGPDGFETVIDLIEQASDGLIAAIKSGDRAPGS